jgi:hypothetical protein
LPCLVVGEVASIARLISLAEQSVQAASSLYTFFKAYKNVHPKIHEVAQALNRLCTLLSNVWKTASRAEVQRSSTYPTLTALIIGIKDCYEFLDNTEKQLDPIKTRPKDKIFTKLKIAAQKDYFPTIYERFLWRERVLATIGLAQMMDLAQEDMSDTGYIYPAHLPPLLLSVTVILSLTHGYRSFI